MSQKERKEKEKRRLSSDGQTPKAPTKMSKMAQWDSGDPDFESKLIDQMTIIADAIDRLQKGQTQLQSTFDSKLDKFRKEFLSSIEDKFKAMKVDVDLELANQQRQIEVLSRSVDSIMKRLQEVEKGEGPYSETRSRDSVNNSNPLNNPEVTIIATNVELEHDEDILETARDLVSQLSESATVTAAARLRSRVQGKPGLVKISLSTVEEKVKILREKRKLKEVGRYRNVFLRGSKSHTERLIELNARTLLSEIPHGHQYRITSNGRIVKKTPNIDSMQDREG